ncbi:hypothetical protein FA95DRAFT_1541325 [Auriscalpium vulgare]|uniref:Uncharacterized protein n=1 Tax=Auriscalpium vulgare TaxID=40419 RepID=A0ACB8RSU6_9AGAM|nr:hypothetical protein FA95DRAFT_1541325 [Auriscalpium vulgare]
MLDIGNKVKKHVKEGDISAFDFNSLTNIVPNSAWIVAIDYQGMVDANLKPIELAKVATTPGSQHSFLLSCHVSEDGARHLRFFKYVYSQGPLSSADALDFVKRSIIYPWPILPNFILFSIKFAPHMAVMRPFLDALPKPFYYRVATPAPAETQQDKEDEGQQDRYQQYIALAEDAKETADAAFRALDRAAALDAYTEALQHLWDALRQRSNDEQEAPGLKKRLAVCLANRAATYLLEGEGIDAERALQDSRMAEKLDPTYPKGYYRQARSHELLGQVEEARQTLQRALARKDVRNKEGLVDALRVLKQRGS